MAENMQSRIVIQMSAAATEWLPRLLCKAMTVAMACALLPATGGAQTLATYRGGSNFVFYALDNCNREPFAVIPNYDEKKAIIDGILAQMYRNGQRSVSINLFFMHGGHNSLMDSTGGDVDEKYKRNLKDFIASAKSIGFQNLMVRFGPQGENRPWRNGSSWPEWREDLYQEHLGLIKSLHPIIAQSGMKYLIDLFSEGIPTANQPMMLRYSQRLWKDYTSLYGKLDTAGISIIPLPSQDRFAQLPAVYGDNPPLFMNIHFYADAFDTASFAQRRLRSLGYGDTPWIIGEAHYNDAEEAQDLGRFIAQTRQKVVYLLQWPETKARTCRDVDVGSPVNFEQYSNAGF